MSDNDYEHDYDEGTDAEDKVGFVVCASCGARIRADRRKCLRCGEPLRPMGTAAPPWMPIQLTRNRALIFGGVAGAIALLLIVVAWRVQPETVDDVVQPIQRPLDAPVRLPVPSDRPVASATPADPGTAPIYEPETLLDGPPNTAAALPAGDVAKTRAQLEQQVTARPNDAVALNNLGQALVKLDSAGEAMPHFERAVALTPDSWAYHFNLARAAALISQWERASDEFRVSAKLRDGQPATHFNLALSLHKRGDDEAAIQQFQRAMALKSDEPRFHVSLAISMEKAGHAADAVREFRRYLELVPNAPDAEQLRAHIQQLSRPQAAPPPAPGRQ